MAASRLAEKSLFRAATVFCSSRRPFLKCLNVNVSNYYLENEYFTHKIALGDSVKERIKIETKSLTGNRYYKTQIDHKVNCFVLNTNDVHQLQCPAEERGGWIGWMDQPMN